MNKANKVLAVIAIIAIAWAVKREVDVRQQAEAIKEVYMMGYNTGENQQMNETRLCNAELRMADEYINQLQYED